MHGHQQTAQVLALTKADAAAINFHHIAHNGETQSGTRLARIEPRAPIKNTRPLSFRDTFAIILDKDSAEAAASFRFNRHKHAAAAVLRGVFKQVSDNLVEILALHRDQRCAASIGIKPTIFVQACHCAFDR